MAKKLDAAAQNKIIQGFDMVLEAVGQTTLTEMLNVQLAGLATLPKEQQEIVLGDIKEHITSSIAGAMGASVEQFKTQFTNPETAAAMKAAVQKQYDEAAKTDV